jgi:hypothetical protein
MHTPTQGFVAVLEDFDELILDVPDAVAIMALFIGRAITDEILPPNFINRILPPTGSNLEVLKKSCAGHLSQLHGAERLLRCWGSGPFLTAHLVLAKTSFLKVGNVWLFLDACMIWTLVSTMNQCTCRLARCQPVASWS